mgnify:CR=1 FL=1
MPSPVYDPAKMNYTIAYTYRSDDGSYYHERWWYLESLRWGDNYDSVSVALLDDTDQGVDFVLINGRNIFTPTGTAWDTGYGTIVPESTTLARKIDGATILDTDSALDWESSYGTLGAVNSLTGNYDYYLWIE